MAYSGAYRRTPPAPEIAPYPPAPAPEHGHPSPGSANQERPEPDKSEPRLMPPGRAGNPRPRMDLGALFAKTEAAGMETDDLLMALILYLMYRESGDTDLLIMQGVMLLT